MYIYICTSHITGFRGLGFSILGVYTGDSILGGNGRSLCGDCSGYMST